MRWLLLASLLSASAWAQEDAPRFEVWAGGAAAHATAFPGSRFPTDVQQLGVDLRGSWWVRPGLAVVLRGLWNARARQTNGWREFPNRYDIGVTYPPNVRYGLLAGTDLSLGAGTLSIGSSEAPFQLLLPAAFGAVDTDLLLLDQVTRTDGSVSPARFGDAGWRLAGSIGLAMRVVVAGRFTVRVEVADFIVPTRITQVNGCDLNDLRAMDQLLRQGIPPDAAPAGTYGASCRVAAFSGVDPATRFPRANVVPMAVNAVRVPTNSLMHLVSVRLGAGVTF